MCASYGALESTLVSTRSTVPGTLASAAARTFAATSPVSSFSVLPFAVCPACDGSRGGLPCWAGAPDAADGVADGDAAVLDVAAPAIAAPLTAAAPTAAAVTSLDRMPGNGPPWFVDGDLSVVGAPQSAPRVG